MSETQNASFTDSGTVTATDVTQTITPVLGGGTSLVEETTIEMPTEPMMETEDPKKVLEPSIVAEVIAGSSEEFRPAVECIENGVCMDISKSTEHETTLDESIRTDCCCAAYGGPFGLWNITAIYVSESLFLLPLQCVLLVLPISTGFMGATYMDRCPMSVPTPLLLFMMGIVGTIIILCRMAIVLTKRFMHFNDCELPKSVVFLGCVVILLFYCTELFCFFRTSPSFDLGAKNFCDETFYNFTYYANWGFFGLILVVMLLYFPRFTTMFNCHRQPVTVQV